MDFDYERIVGVIREELDRSMRPVLDSLLRVETSIEKTYTKELVDAKFRERDRAIRQNQRTIEDLKKTVGGFWINTIQKGAAVAGLLALVLEIWHQVGG